MNNNLFKYFKGKYSNCKLQASTIISNLVTIEVEGYDGLVLSTLVSKVSDCLLRTKGKCTIEKRKYHDLPGKEITVTTYCFSEAEFESLVNDVFEMGRVSANE